MPLFVITCLDKPDSLELRMATRQAHLDWVGGKPELKFGGPFLDEAGRMVGSMALIEAEDLAAAKAFAAEDPYGHAGLFQSVEVRAWRCTVGSIGA